MPAYNFKRVFADCVRAGVDQAFAARHPEVRPKRQTIRQRRKRRTRVGETLYLYVGQRTKRCEKLGETTCKAVVPIVIHADGAVDLGGQKLTNEEREALARNDGFEGLDDFYGFFEQGYGLPFEGVVLKW
jgi:hypothetical protein